MLDVRNFEKAKHLKNVHQQYGQTAQAAGAPAM